MTGQVLSTYDSGGKNVIDVDVNRLLNPPKRFKDEGDEVADQGALLIVDAKVKITKDGKRISLADIEADDNLRVMGKFLRPAKWLKDEDDEPTPTLRAKRIEVL
jgi:hypothetical protein